MGMERSSPKESLLFSLLNIKHYIFITSSGCSIVELLSWSPVVLIHPACESAIDPKFIVIDCNHQIPIISIDCNPSIDEQWWRRRDMRSIYFHVPSIKCIKIQFILLNFKLFSIKLPISFFFSLLFAGCLSICISFSGFYMHAPPFCTAMSFLRSTKIKKREFLLNVMSENKQADGWTESI